MISDLDYDANEFEAKSPRPTLSPLGRGEGDGTRLEGFTVTSNRTLFDQDANVG